MILRDQEQRSWPMEFRDYGMYACIGRGWSNFCVANDLKEGQAFKFVLIKNGKKPIVTIHSKFSLLRHLLCSHFLFVTPSILKKCLNYTFLTY